MTHIRTSNEILAGMAELFISGSQRWTRYMLAADDLGAPVDVDSPDAKCWCLLGAKVRVMGYNTPAIDPINQEVRMKLAAVIRARFPERVIDVHRSRPAGAVISNFNDHPDTTFEDVLSVIQSAREITP